MSERYWDGDWPNLNSISIALPADFMWGASPATVGVVYKMVSYIGSQSVHSPYSDAKENPSIPSDERKLRKLLMVGKKEWREALPFVERMFVLNNDRWWLSDDQVLRFTRPMARKAISVDAKLSVMARGGARCTYCGTVEGPFHYDHIFPVSRGGTNDPSNLALACASCNMSKGSLTLAEWVGRNV